MFWGTRAQRNFLKWVIIKHKVGIISPPSCVSTRPGIQKKTDCPEMSSVLDLCCPLPHSNLSLPCCLQDMSSTTVLSLAFPSALLYSFLMTPLCLPALKSCCLTATEASFLRGSAHKPIQNSPGTLVNFKIKCMSSAECIHMGYFRSWDPALLSLQAVSPQPHVLLIHGHYCFAQYTTAAPH